MGRQSLNELPLFAGTAVFCGALRDSCTLITALPLLLSVRACMRVRVCVAPSTPAHELAPEQRQEVHILPGSPVRSAVYRISSVRERVFFLGRGHIEVKHALSSRSREYSFLRRVTRRRQQRALPPLCPLLAVLPPPLRRRLLRFVPALFLPLASTSVCDGRVLLT